MACKDDASWEGGIVSKDQCVKWEDLTALRVKYNTFWDNAKLEEAQKGFKYGFISETDESCREQTEALADIEGFCSVEFNSNGEALDVYFKITAGDIIRRLDYLGSQYNYQNDPNGTNFGPWVVHLKDPCFGCTVFRFQSAAYPYSREITCKQTYIQNIDNPTWYGQCIEPGNGGCAECWGPFACESAIPLNKGEDYCGVEFDWRTTGQPGTFRQIAADLFYAGPVCVPIDEPCTVSRLFCCNKYAIAHYTEEWDDPSDCPQNDPSNTLYGGGVQYVKRRLKWVSLLVNLTNPSDEDHGGIGDPDGGPSFFCCNNTITGGLFKGFVTQKISAIHLTHIWDKVNETRGGKTLRQCTYDQCKYPETQDKKDRWAYKDAVPMYSKTEPDIMDRASACDNCDKTSVGEPICACNFNDISAMLDEYNDKMWCFCYSGKYKDQTLINVGDLSNCDCCPGKCCCDCNCVDGIGKEDCEKKTCSKGGPVWIPVYKKGESQNDSKFGDQRPCGCWEEGDPSFPDKSCMEKCGITSVCCIAKTCSCLITTKCDCDDQEGTWKGYKLDGSAKTCDDEDIKSAVECGAEGACCGKGSGSGECYCTVMTKCACEDSGGTWKGADTKCEDYSAEVACGATGACCEKGDNGYDCACTITTECDCAGNWLGVDSKCESCNFPTGECCAPESCSCSGKCPGPNCEGEGGEPDGCCCDERCYTGCGDCCDQASAVACCSGKFINSLFEEFDDPLEKVIISVDEVINGVSHINDDYDFVTNAFDIFLIMNGMYVYKIESIKINNLDRYLAIRELFDLNTLYLQSDIESFSSKLESIYERCNQMALSQSGLFRKYNSDFRIDETERSILLDKILNLFNELKNELNTKINNLNYVLR